MAHRWIGVYMLLVTVAVVFGQDDVAGESRHESIWFTQILAHYRDDHRNGDTLWILVSGATVGRATKWMGIEPTVRVGVSSRRYNDNANNATACVFFTAGVLHDSHHRPHRLDFVSFLTTKVIGPWLYTKNRNFSLNDHHEEDMIKHFFMMKTFCDRYATFTSVSWKRWSQDVKKQSTMKNQSTVLPMVIYRYFLLR
jgi:hypothetical protein